MSDDASKPGAGDAPSSPPSDNAGGDSGSGSGSSGFSAERMSPSERAAIRQRLLERQRAAARGNGTSAPTPATTGTGSTPAPSAAPAGPTYSAETGTTVPPRAPSGIPAWQLQDANTLLNKPGIPSASEVPAVTASETPSTPAPAPEGPPLRENMVAQAVSFLSSPKVQSSPKDRQDSFLKTKGVTDAEIAEARRRVAGGAPTSSPSSPSVSTPAGAAPAATPGTYTGATASSEALAAKLQAQQSQQSAQARIAAEQAAREAQQKAMEAFEEAKKKREEALARRKMQDYIMLAMILGGGAFGVLRAIKNVVVSTYNTFWSLYATHLGHKRTQLIGYLTNMSSFLTLYRTPGPADSEAERERRIRRALSGLGPDPEMTVPLALEKYSAGLDAAFDSVKASIEAQTKVVKDRWVLNPPLPRYSYIAPEPAEDDVPSDFKTMRRWMDATKRLCENEAYFSAASAYGLGGAGSYWNSSSSGDEKNKSEAAKALHETITDIKADLRALKGQLLSRKNFPTTVSVPTFTGSFAPTTTATTTSTGSTTPSVAPRVGIPSWQQSSSSSVGTPGPATTNGIPPWQMGSTQSAAEAAANGDLASAVQSSQAAYAATQQAGSAGEASGSGAGEEAAAVDATEEAVRNSLVAAE